MGVHEGRDERVDDVDAAIARECPIICVRAIHGVLWSAHESSCRRTGGRARSPSPRCRSPTWPSCGPTLDFSPPGKPTDTDVVDKRYVAETLLGRDRGFARHREVNLAYSCSAHSTRARSSALFAGIL